MKTPPNSSSPSVGENIAVVEPDESKPTSPPSQRTRTNRLWMLAVVTAPGLIALGVWCSYTADQRNDQYQLILLGQRVHDGGRLYIDAWENKPPGIAWLSALGIALSGGTWRGAWLMPGAVGLISLLVMGATMRRLLGPAAAGVTIVLASIVYTLRLYDAPSVNPDFYSSMFELSACSFWLSALRAERHGRLVVPAMTAGLVWSAALMCKQTGVVGLIAVTMIALMNIVASRFIRGTNNVFVKTTKFAWFGFISGLLIVIGVLLYRQNLGAAYEAVFSFNRSLISLDRWSGLFRSWPRVWAGLEPLQLPLWLAMVGFIVTARLFKGARMPAILLPVVCTLLLWWVMQVVLATLGPSRSMRYWQAAFPSMLWLIGVGVYHLYEVYQRAGQAHRVTAMLVGLTLAVLLGRPLLDHYRHGLATTYLTWQSDETQRDRLEAIGREVQAIVPQDQALYVWAYDAGVYLYAHRSPASRFTYPRSAEQMREILADLRSNHAFALLIPGTDFPGRAATARERKNRNQRKNGSGHSTSSPMFDAWCNDSCRHELEQILTKYDRADEPIGPYTVWTRRAADPPATPG